MSQIHLSTLAWLSGWSNSAGNPAGDKRKELVWGYISHRYGLEGGHTKEKIKVLVWRGVAWGYI